MGSGRLQRLPGLGYKTADVLVCLRTRSVMSLLLHSCLEASPYLRILPSSKQPFPGRTLGPAAAAPAGLEEAGLSDHLVLDGEQLPPRDD